MSYVKKLVIQGFKSFPSKTEIPFENNMNIIVGPNGSGKSNITDSICFVLGRLSIKSIRAAKAANLLFSGNKYKKPASEAFVELIFDNSDKTFALDTNEVSIKRIVRKNGQSIYKINNETKTRQELLELLAQAGIDPYGFNIILQGEIASLIKITPEERRKIIEEVAGISIYETRREKSLREMEKTDEKLKEVSAILRERTNYLKNLEKERQEALNYQRLEEIINRCKATIILKELKEKEKEVYNVEKNIENQDKETEKIKQQIDKNNKEILRLEEEINKINKLIQSSTSNEQEILHKEISELKAQIAGLKVRKENFENRLEDNRIKKERLQEKTEELEKEISKIRISSPEIKKQREKIKEYQDTVDRLEKDRRRFYVIKSELSTFQNKKTEKDRFLIELKKEVELIEKNISSLFEEIKHRKSIEKLDSLKQETYEEIEKTKKQLIILEEEILKLEKEDAALSHEISAEENLKNDIVKLDICPLCKNKITRGHIDHVILNANKKIEHANQINENNKKQRSEIQKNISNLKQILSELEKRLNEIEIDIFKLKNAEEKKEYIKKISENQRQVESDLESINSRISVLRNDFEKLKNIEEEYDEARLKLQEISFYDTDIDTEITIKQRELNRLKNEIRSITRDKEESGEELKKISSSLIENEKELKKKEQEEQELYERFQKLFNDKNVLQDQLKGIETNIIGFQHTMKNYENEINSLKIHKAKIDAEKESLNFNLREFENLEPINLPLEQVKEKLQKTQIRISQIGSVNLRALDVYDKVKEQCKMIEEKVDTVNKEKEKIIKIIEEIDRKKKKSFLKTLEAVNEYFSRNFMQLSKKGEVFLDLENKQDPFAAGLNIIVKIGRGKYFDVKSLSGGEKTLIALSLIFAIQEYKPYCFYIFDEIDAALDKHNSEKLAALIKRYMVSGQYIIITHNDALISEASVLYGVSMQENVSKVISLKI